MPRKKVSTEGTGKIKVSDFVEGYLKISPKVQGLSGREQYVKDIKVVDYVPFRDKLGLATRIVRATIEDRDGNFNQSSPVRYILLVMQIIKTYTSLDIQEGLEMYDDYDLLNQNGLIEEILAVIPDKEYSEFTTLSKMIQDDIIANKYETHVFFTNLVSSMVGGLDNILGAVLGNENLMGALENLSKLENKEEK